MCLILARGGSKGIPKKNIIDLNGKPLIAYAINAAKQSSIDDVWVSTDCKKIKKISLEYGAQVVDRPQELSTDESVSEDALLHFAKLVKFDILVFIQPTSPLINKNDINKGIKLLINNKYDSVFSAYKEHWVPRWTLNNQPINWDTKDRPRRQDVQENYVENGAFYITTRKQLLNSGLRYGGTIGTLEMPIKRSFQIDTYEDLQLIEKLLINE